jgi:hypothetical protein
VAIQNVLEAWVYFKILLIAMIKENNKYIVDARLLGRDLKLRSQKSK